MYTYMHACMYIYVQDAWFASPPAPLFHSAFHPSKLLCIIVIGRAGYAQFLWNMLVCTSACRCMSTLKRQWYVTWHFHPEKIVAT